MSKRILLIAAAQALAPVAAPLFDSLTVGENVALPLREHSKMKDQEIRKLVSETLDSVGLAHVEERFPAELSGGMVKRAGFARAVITNPKAVLYDEPTTGLDPIINRGRDLARPGEHLYDGRLHRDAVRRRHRGVRNR